MQLSSRRALVHLGSSRGGFSGRALDRVSKDEEEITTAIDHHQLRAGALAAIHMAYSGARADATRFDIAEEIDVLDEGIERAKGRSAALEIVARKVNALSNADSTDFTRTFGG